MSQNSELLEQWEQVSQSLRHDIGNAVFDSWLSPLRPLSLSQGVMYLGAPTSFLRDWVTSHYTNDILSLWQTLSTDIQGIEIVVQGKSFEERIVPQNFSTPAAESIDTDWSRDNCLDPRFTFENFVVGKPNDLAHAAARRVAEAKTVTFNPLFLYGGVGLGKTHLMHAIAWHIKRYSPERKVLYLSAEKFMYQFIKALRFKDTMSFKDEFRSVDVLMIDDVQFISGKDSTQEEFFHTFNALVDQNHQIVVSADKSPSDLDGMEERMKSRLGWGLVADIHPTTYELRLGILHSKVESLGLNISNKVLEFLAAKITSNIREMEGALNRIVAHSNLTGNLISLESSQDLLKDLLRKHDKRLSIEDIQKRVAEHFGIRASEMYSARRIRSIAVPRQVAMYLSKLLTPYSLPEIGRKFGGRDHTTVIHAVKKIELTRNEDPSFSHSIDLLIKILES